jgi:phosphinothricin acetyltransferase
MSITAFVDCSLAAHGAAILDIYNEVIANSTAVYEYQPFDANYIEKWFADKRAGDYPVIGALNDAGVLIGFASYGVFRARPAYKYTVEHSVYVHKDHRGKGIGRELLKRIIEAARTQNYHVMIGGIDAENEASIALHKQFGFVHAGTITQSGFKFGRWLDLVFYQLTLATPINPVDG